MDAKPQTTELPAVGSVWLAGDGRIMRVEKWFSVDYFGNRAAKMIVLNPGHRMRRITQADLRGFGSFLKPHQEAKSNAR